MAKNYPVAKASFDYTDWTINNPKLIEIKEQKDPSVPIVSEATNLAQSKKQKGQKSAKGVKNKNKNTDITHPDTDGEIDKVEDHSEEDPVILPVENANKKPPVSKAKGKSADKDLDQI